MDKENKPFSLICEAAANSKKSATITNQAGEEIKVTPTQARAVLAASELFTPAARVRFNELEPADQMELADALSALTK